MCPLRILVADDHESVRTGVRRLLSSRPDWSVCGEAANGREAVEQAKALRPDLVLMDITMPEMGGVEAARIIRKEFPETAVIIISQNDKKLMQWAAAEAGAKGYLEKSKLSRELVTAVETLVLNNGKSSGNAVLNPVGSGSEGQTGDSDCLAGGGQMGERMRSMDWSRTPLGPLSQWPQSLKTSVSICLASRFPIVLYWGPECVVLYNDAYRTILGSKHPWALGQRCRDCWAEIWDTIGPMLEGVIQSGEATWSNDLLLVLNRNGYAEECYFSFSFSPVRVEAGAVGGIFTAVIETTDNIIGERRLRTLRDLAAQAVDANSEDNAYRIAAETLAENSRDVPFSALCSLANSQSRILFSTGIPANHPLQLLLSGSGSNLAERLQQAVELDHPLEVDLHLVGCELPMGAWDAAASKALLMPVSAASGDTSPAVLLF